MCVDDNFMIIVINLILKELFIMPEETKAAEATTLEAFERKLHEEAVTLKSADVIDRMVYAKDYGVLEKMVEGIPDTRKDGWGITGGIDNKHTTAKELLDACSKTAIGGAVNAFDKALESYHNDAEVSVKIVTCFSIFKAYLELEILVLRRNKNAKQIEQILEVTQAIQNKSVDKDKLIAEYKNMDQARSNFEKNVVGGIVNNIGLLVGSDLPKVLHDAGMDEQKKVDALKDRKAEHIDKYMQILDKELMAQPSPTTRISPAGEISSDGDKIEPEFMSVVDVTKAVHERKQKIGELFNKDYNPAKREVLLKRGEYTSHKDEISSSQNEIIPDYDELFKNLGELEREFEEKYTEFFPEPNKTALDGLENNGRITKKEFLLVMDKTDKFIEECQKILDSYKALISTNKKQFENLSVVIEKINQESAEQAEKQKKEAEKQGLEPAPEPTPGQTLEQKSEQKQSTDYSKIIEFLKGLVGSANRFNDINSPATISSLIESVPEENDQRKTVKTLLSGLKKYVNDNESSFSSYQPREADYREYINENELARIQDSELRKAIIDAFVGLANEYSPSRRLHKDVSRAKRNEYRNEKAVRSTALQKWMKRLEERLNNYQFSPKRGETYFIVSKQAESPTDAALLEFRNSLYDARLLMYGMNPKNQGETNKVWQTLTNATNIDKKLKEFKKNNWIKGKSEEMLYNLYATIKTCGKDCSKLDKYFKKLKNSFTGLKGAALKLSGATIYPLKTQFTKLLDVLGEFLKLQKYDQIANCEKESLDAVKKKLMTATAKPDAK